MMPFYFVAAGALALIASKAFNLPLAAIGGILLTLSGSLWATLSPFRRRSPLHFN
jgi:hypothetical protein